MSYEEIAKRGGGILNSADRLHDTSEEELYRQAMERIDEIIAMGTGLVEIKSGGSLLPLRLSGLFHLLPSLPQVIWNFTAKHPQLTPLVSRY